jgi:hypothetical protein
MRISNMNGSELLPLQVPVQTQYWNGAGYTNNGVDNCTSLVNTNFTQSPGPGTAISTSIVSGATASGGSGTIGLTKPFPTPPAKGSVLLSPGATISSYLPMAAGGGRETFGVFKSGRIIHLREVY